MADWAGPPVRPFMIGEEWKNGERLSGGDPERRGLRNRFHASAITKEPQGSIFPVDFGSGYFDQGV